MMKHLIKRRTSHYCRLVILLVVVLPALARPQDSSILVVYARSGLIAAIPGQTLRVTLSDLTAASEPEMVLEPLSVLVELCDAAGEVIAQTESATVHRAGFNCSISTAT